MNRRGFLLLAAAGTVGSLAALGRLADTPPSQPATSPSSPSGDPGRAKLGLAGAPGAESYVPASVIDRLPGAYRQVALTIDDGVSSDVVAAYIQFAKDTGARLTFFVNGMRPSWTVNAPALRPLVDSGQIQLANHTWSHRSLPSLSDRTIATEIDSNDQFLQRIYGMSGRPFLRPPYGQYDDRTRRIATEHGYWVTTIWYGSLGDSDPTITEAQLLANARKWLQAQRIVIGHANQPPVTHLYGQLADIIRERNLHMVTLNDVFSTR